MKSDPRKIDRLMALTERLTQALEDDIAALERGRPREMRTPKADVQQLTVLYRNEAAHFTPAAVKDLPKDTRDRLEKATAHFKDVLAVHRRLVTRVKDCTDGMIRAIADDVARKRNAQRPYVPQNVAKPKTPGALIYNRVV
jgi:hypothetical protein